MFHIPVFCGLFVFCMHAWAAKEEYSMSLCKQLNSLCQYQIDDCQFDMRMVAGIFEPVLLMHKFTVCTVNLISHYWGFVLYNKYIIITWLVIIMLGALLFCLCWFCSSGFWVAVINNYRIIFFSSFFMPGNFVKCLNVSTININMM